jgi:chemotaxis protein histidine kinase CheA
MELDRDDLAALCKGMTRDEVERVHRLLHEWGIGPEDSFPVQLALLTLAQLKAAASVPRSIADSRKWLELHLAEYRRQTQSLLDDFNQTVQTGTRDFDTSLSAHTKTIENTVQQIQAQLDVAEEVAARIKSLMANATSQWEHVRARATAECERLQKISNDLQDRFAWRVMLQFAAFFLLVSIVSVMAGHYLWKH